VPAVQQLLPPGASEASYVWFDERRGALRILPIVANVTAVGYVPGVDPSGYCEYAAATLPFVITIPVLANGTLGAVTTDSMASTPDVALLRHATVYVPSRDIVVAYGGYASVAPNNTNANCTVLLAQNTSVQCLRVSTDTFVLDLATLAWSVVSQPPPSVNPAQFAVAVATVKYAPVYTLGLQLLYDSTADRVLATGGKPCVMRISVDVHGSSSSSRSLVGINPDSSVTPKLHGRRVSVCKHPCSTAPPLFTASGYMEVYDATPTPNPVMLTYALNLTTWGWAVLPTTGAPCSASVQPCAGPWTHGLVVYNPLSHELAWFGGTKWYEDFSGAKCFVLDLTALAWRQPLQCQWSNGPQFRYLPATVVVPTLGGAVMLGGVVSQVRRTPKINFFLLSDAWYLQLTDGAGSSGTSASMGPGAYSWHDGDGSDTYWPAPTVASDGTEVVEPYVTSAGDIVSGAPTGRGMQVVAQPLQDGSVRLWLWGGG